MNIIALAILVTIVGALPFGLVNLTVLDVSYRDGNRNAMRIANGAAWVEVLFGLIALLAGSLISQNIEKNLVIKYLVLMIPAIVGIIFLFKKKFPSGQQKDKQHGLFSRGIFKPDKHSGFYVLAFGHHLFKYPSLTERQYPYCCTLYNRNMVRKNGCSMDLFHFQP